MTQNDNQETARIFDLKTKTLRTIPAREALTRRYRQGKSLSACQVRADEGGLCSAAIRLWGSWKTVGAEVKATLLSGKHGRDQRDGDGRHQEDDPRQKKIGP